MLLANHCGDRQSPGLTGGDVEGYSTGPKPAQFLYKLGHAGEADLCGRGKLHATKGDFAGPKIADALSERGSAWLMVVGTNSHVTVGASNTLLIGPGEVTILGLSKSWPRLPWHSPHPGNLDRPVAPSGETVRPSRNDERLYGPYPRNTGTGGYSDLLERISLVERQPIRARLICNTPIRAFRPCARPTTARLVQAGSSWELNHSSVPT